MTNAAWGRPSATRPSRRPDSSTSWPCSPTSSSGRRSWACRPRPPRPRSRRRGGRRRPAGAAPRAAGERPGRVVRPARALLTVSRPGCTWWRWSDAGMAADPNRVPWGNMYEFTLSGTSWSSLIYLVLYRKFYLAWMGPLVVGPASALMVAVIWLHDPVGPLPEALDSPGWSSTSSPRSSRPARSRSAARLGVYLVKTARRRRRPVRPGCPSPGRARPGGLPDPRLRVPGVDLRGPDHRPDLGAPGLVVVLELGPQGGLGVHHLGGLRRPTCTPARPPAGRAATPRSWRWSAPRRCGSTSSGSTTSQLEPALVRRRCARPR